jgi:hypothetical protein
MNFNLDPEAALRHWSAEEKIGKSTFYTNEMKIFFVQAYVIIFSTVM